MLHQDRTSRYIGVAMIGAFLAACGTVPQTTENMGTKANLPQNAPMSAPSTDEDPELKLTPQQKKEIFSLIAEHRRKVGTSLFSQARKLRALIKGADFNAIKFAERLKADRESILERIPQVVETLVKIRNVFTPEQRTVLRERLSDKLATIAEEDTETADQLNLTSEQRAKLEKLRPQIAGRMFRHALRTFIEDGDREVLTSALEGAIDQLPAPGVIANALASLTPEQRQKFVDMVQGEEGPDDDTMGVSPQSALQPSGEFSSQWVRVGWRGGYRGVGWRGAYRAPYAYAYPTYTYAYTPWVTTAATYPITYFW